jgi:hypothetical protein
MTGSAGGICQAFVSNSATGPFGVGIYYFDPTTSGYVQVNRSGGTGAGGYIQFSAQIPDAPGLLQIDNQYTATQNFTFSVTQP